MCNKYYYYFLKYYLFKFLFFISDIDDTWIEEEKLEAHSNWVRDVAWAPSAHFGQSVIASCSQVCSFHYLSAIA